MTTSNYQQQLDILRLFRSENIGCKTFHQLIELYGDATAALEHLPELIKKNPKCAQIKICTLDKAEQEFEQIANFKGQLICYLDSSYPTLLKQITNFPPILTVKGNVQLLSKNIMAIVGARNASANGIAFTAQLARDLSNQNIVIASGLARGIDSAAHKASLHQGTIAVIAAGIDNIYPLENKNLYQSISEIGLLIAELPFGSLPRTQHFPMRNRIISGISSSLAVIEAGLNSGSLITANYALEQNRNVFAAPGFPLDPRSKGSNNLIRQGATLLESAQDMLSLPMSFNNFAESNNLLTKKWQYFDESELDDVKLSINSLLSACPINIDELIDLTGLTAHAVSVALLELEITGTIERHPGNKISLSYRSE